jgi:hypothetical protein
MSETRTTVTDECQMISDWRGESSNDTSAKRIRAISRAAHDFALARRWRTHRLTDQVITSGGTGIETIGSVTYPMRTKGLAEVFVGGTTEDKRYQIVDFNKYKNLYNSNNSLQICYEYYDPVLDLWKVKINPSPAVGVIITYTYYFVQPDFTTVSDTVICDDQSIIAHLALADIYGQEEEFEKQALEEQKAREEMKNLEGYEDAPADNQLYQMGSVENSRKDQGIGNY